MNVFVVGLNGCRCCLYLNGKPVYYWMTGKLPYTGKSCLL